MPCSPPTRLSASRRSSLLVVDAPRAAPCARANASLSSVEAQAITRAPISRPSSTAASPTPPEAPSTASVSPGFSWARCCERVIGGAVGDGQRGGAVEVEIGGDLDDLVGRDGRAFARRVEIGVAHDAVAGLRTSVTPAPTLSTTPANSPPGENGNGGLIWYLPAMIRVSKKFRPTAATLATTSPGAGDRIGDVREHEVVGRCRSVGREWLSRLGCSNGVGTPV